VAPWLSFENSWSSQIATMGRRSCTACSGGICAVDPVELAVVVEAAGGVILAGLALVEGDRAGLVVEVDAAAVGVLELGVGGGLVDVVAEVDEEVELLAEQLAVDVVVAAAVVLTGDVGEAHGLVGVFGGGCAGLAGTAGPSHTLVGVEESIKIGGGGVEAAHLDLDAAAVGGLGGDDEVIAAVEGEQVGELFVGGELEVELVGLGEAMIGVA
jgi:hypothetical protein